MKYKPTVSEHIEQVALFKWASIATFRDSRLSLMFAIPNGGARHIVTATKLKAEGVKAGVPDIFLPVPSNGWNGLFIEMKSTTGKATRMQIEWLDALGHQGYFVQICNGCDEARETIEEYLRSDNQ